MNDEIYQRAIKELAQAGHGAGRLPAPSASAQLDNPLCGDRITVDVNVADGRILALGHDTRGCLLCRAAASLLGREAPSRGLAEFAAAEMQIAALLQGDHTCAPDWPDIKVFVPVAGYRSRHGCVLLPFRTLRVALNAV